MSHTEEKLDRIAEALARVEERQRAHETATVDFRVRMEKQIGMLQVEVKEGRNDSRAQFIAIGERILRIEQRVLGLENENTRRKRDIKLVGTMLLAVGTFLGWLWDRLVQFGDNILHVFK